MIFPPAMQGKDLAKLLDEDPTLMDRRQQCSKRLELYKAAREEIDSVSWSRWGYFNAQPLHHVLYRDCSSVDSCIYWVLVYYFFFFFFLSINSSPFLNFVVHIRSYLIIDHSFGFDIFIFLYYWNLCYLIFIIMQSERLGFYYLCKLCRDIFFFFSFLHLLLHWYAGWLEKKPLDPEASLYLPWKSMKGSTSWWWWAFRIRRSMSPWRKTTSVPTPPARGGGGKDPESVGIVRVVGADDQFGTASRVSLPSLPWP